MIRALRPLFAFALSLLLLGMQLEGTLHALNHVGQALGHSRDHSLAVPSDEACAECTLLAPGANALAGGGAETTVTLAAQERPQPAPVSVTPAFSSYYQSRAPPALL
ncbi:MAG: hypothetical protein M3R31_01835 [Pseudomonadota bacterium]|nr:hypothetical protein [Pseudomonadota bacterium]